jgi:hypothetical protein
METTLSDGESGRGRGGLFIAVEGGRRAIRGGWLATVVRIQCFGLRWEATGRSIAGR